MQFYDEPITDSNAFVENGRIITVEPLGAFSGFAGKKIDIFGMRHMPNFIKVH